MNKKKIYLIIVIILFLSLAFYWYEYRPAKIRKRCLAATISVMKEKNNRSSKLENEILLFDLEYKICLRRVGVKAD